MAVDYLSAMNVGSGLNVTQIVDALVEAEKAPREAQITEKIEEKNCLSFGVCAGKNRI